LRLCVVTALALCAEGGASWCTDWAGATSIPITPLRADANLAPFDEEVTAFMAARGIPGGALAVTRGGKLVLASGYGWADEEGRRPVEPGSLFRIASVSKPITAVAVFHLLEETGLTLEARAVDLIRPTIGGVGLGDERLAQVTLRHLLQHTAGWDRAISGDPMFECQRIAEAQGVPCPPGPRDIVRYTLGRPLDFAPGERSTYSNFGYCVLGRVIEDVSGMPYEQYVQQRVLRPLGIVSMRIGRSLEQDAVPGEVRYYHPSTGTSVFAQNLGTEVPAPYGSFCIESMDAHGGWIASAMDLVRFACALDDPEHCPVLSSPSVQTMFARPEGSAGYEDDGTPRDAFYACGWLVRPVGAEGKANQWHNGLLAGTSTLLVRRFDGLDWVVLFNQSADASGLSYGDIDPALHRAAARVTDWPADDLFGRLSAPGG